MVHEPYKIAICLPPKCGTTNWQSAMNVLEKDAKHIPPPSGNNYWKPEEFKSPQVYNILKNADIRNSKDTKMISDWTKILNTRHCYIDLFDSKVKTLNYDIIQLGIDMPKIGLFRKRLYDQKLLFGGCRA